MSRTRERVVPESRETPDRRAFIRWMGDRTLDQLAEALDRSKPFMSRWLRHQAQIDDLEVDRWVQVTGISRRKFLEGRYASRKLMAELEAA